MLVRTPSASPHAVCTFVTLLIWQRIQKLMKLSFPFPPFFMFAEVEVARAQGFIFYISGRCSNIRVIMKVSM